MPSSSSAHSFAHFGLEGLLNYRDKTGLALVHNRIPFLRELFLRATDTYMPSIAVKSISVSVVLERDENEVIKPFSIPLPSLARGQEHRIDLRPLVEVHAGIIAKYDESVYAKVKLTFSTDMESRSEEFPLRILAHDEWFNSEPYWQSLVAFIQPNSERVLPVVQETQNILRKRTSSDAIEGYQGGTARAIEISAAVFEALRSQQIGYVEPPASFENTGQRIRSSSVVLETKLGTCVDLSLTYAAMAEFAGLRSVVILISGHAMAGILTQQGPALPSPVLTDRSMIQNLISSQQLMPIDAVDFCSGRTTSFTHSVKEAKARILRAVNNQDDHLALVSIRDSREDGLKPLPTLRELSEEMDSSTDPQASPEDIQWDVDQLLSRILENDDVVTAVDEKAPWKVNHWQKQLLDLSRNNRLLNLKPGKEVRSLELRMGMLPLLDDLIHQGVPLDLHPYDDISENRRAQGAKKVGDLPAEYISESLTSRHRLYLEEVTEKTYKRELTGLRRNAQSLLEETGSSSLFLTLGSMQLQHKKGEVTEAPLFLIPIRFTGGKGRSRHQIVMDSTQIATPNHSLVEWLRQVHSLDLKALSEPPLDESGLDIDRAVKQIAQELVKANLGFEVMEKASIIIAKFNTYDMWRDISEHWELFMQSPVFRHFSETNGQLFDDPAGNDLLRDLEVDEKKLPLPIRADGTQLQAITAAAAGRSFVLEGPPGTGKSQTITNLIAHCLDQGKRILFVAQKPAALQVVKSRLKKIGLAPFTLDLHGKDLDGSTVRARLKSSLDATASHDSHFWEALQADLRNRLVSFEDYPAKIHEENVAGHSLWSAVTTEIQLGDGPVANIPQDFVSRKNIGTDSLVDLFADLGRVREVLSADVIARWNLIGASRSPFKDTDIDAAWSQLREAFGILETHSCIRDLLHEGFSLPEISEHAETVNRIPLDDRLNAAQRAQAKTTPSALRNLANEITEFSREIREWKDLFHADFLQNGDDKALAQAAEDFQHAGLFKKKKKRAIYEALLANAVSFEITSILDVDGAHSPQRITRLVQRIPSIRVKAAEFSERISELPQAGKLTGSSPLASDYPEKLEDHAELMDHQLNFAQNVPQLLDLAPGELSDLPGAANAVEIAWQNWCQVLHVSHTSFKLWSADRHWVDAWSESMEYWSEDLGADRVRTLKKVQDWQLASRRLHEIGLATLVHQQLKSPIEMDQCDRAVRRGLAQASLAERIVHFELDQFNVKTKEKQLSNLLATMEQIRDQAQKVLPSRLLENRVVPSGATDQTGQLYRQLELERNAPSFRSLFERFPEEILRTTPCFLVSPDTLAKLIKPGVADFDLVIFDEASQIPVDHAMGAIGRARSVIIVGDSKQMPPTRIGQAKFEGEAFLDVEEDEQAQLEDLESVLEEAVAAGLPQLWLSWHYRSQDEALIAFSNANYYDGRLASLPSPGGMPGAGIELRRLDGVFLRTGGEGNRTNRVEAEAIVEEVRLRFNDPETFEESLGVVTFNQPQQHLIEKLLNELNDPMVNKRLNAELEDDHRLFVKNLESVQGDERDVILFSLAFSKDPSKADASLSLNFGPITRTGGEKRLNVAITRARKSVVIFSSFDAEDIDLNRTKSKGLEDLRSYMLMAKQGPQKTAARVENHPEENLIRDFLAAKLRSRGFETQTNFGLSSFKLDVVIRPVGDPRWHVAVLLDGPRWAERSTVADRDLTSELLKPLMGWAEVRRVWLPQFIEDPESVIDSLIEAVHQAETSIAADDKRREQSEMAAQQRLEEQRQETQEQVAEDELDHQDADNHPWEFVSEAPGSEYFENPFIYPHDVDQDIFSEVEYAEGPKSDSVLIDGPIEISPVEPVRVSASALQKLGEEGSLPLFKAQDPEVNVYPFIEFDLRILGDLTEVRAGFTLRRQQELRPVIEAAIDHYGPIELQDLRVKILHSFGGQRTSEKTKKNIDGLIPPELIQGEPIGELEFAWPRGANPATWNGVRSDGSIKTVEHLPLRELANAMKCVIASEVQSHGHLRVDRKQFFKKVLALFGLSRLSATAEVRLQMAFDVFHAELPIEMTDFA